MKLEAKTLFALQALLPRHRGVFSSYDLANLFLTLDSLGFNRKLKPFLRAGVLRRFCRGYYVAEKFDLEWLSQRLCPHSAISLGTVLAKAGLIGNIPQKTVYAVKIGKSRIYESRAGSVVHLGYSSPSIGRKLWAGYTIGANGIRYADQEKAFLDTLYFYQLGHKFSFNVYSDIAVERLHLKKVESYLKKYQNPKFKTFVKGVLRGHDSI